MAKEKSINWGAYAFLIGLIVALVAGILSAFGTGLPGWLAVVLVIIGLVVGLFNITDKEIMPFLWAGVVLVIVSSQGAATLEIIPTVGTFLATILNSLMLIFVPATIIVAMKVVFAVAQN